MTDKKAERKEILSLTTDIVASHVSNNIVSLDEISNLIEQVYHTLAKAGGAAEAPPPPALRPAVPIKRSITPDYLICLEDGKKLKMLKRHLKTSYNLSPDDYRQRWGLAADYPMVAPNYADRRRALAKEIGLGRSRKS